MGTLLLLLIIVFIIIPLLRGMFAIFRARKTVKKYFDQFRQAQNTGNSRSDKNSAEHRSTRKRKKINPEDGEFVAFEDIPGSVCDNDAQTKKNIAVEQQIVDVEWEDIK